MMRETRSLTGTPVLKETEIEEWGEVRLVEERSI
jgi:hypothetical protein